MKARRTSRRAFAFSAAILASVALASCGARQPTGSAAPRLGPGETADPLPPLPHWAGAYIGKGLREVFPGDGQCDGNTDRIDLRYRGAAPGAKIIGWGWDMTANKPVERIVLVDKDLQIVGAGQTGLPREDVTGAKPFVTDPNSGWSAITPLASGAVDAYGITGETAVCKLGHAQL
jgi:hypothetical protein